jgi:hypothetical protein
MCPMNPRLLRPTSSSLDPDAAVYLNAVAVADGEQLEPAVRKAINDFVKGCKADGIWDAIKASCILAGARTLTGALVPLVGPTPSPSNFTGGDYDRKTGLKGGGSGSGKIIDTNRANDADPQDSNHNAVWVHAADDTGTASSYLDSGGTVSGSNNLGRSSTAANIFLRSRTSTVSNNLAFGDATGLVGINRSGSADYVLRASSTNTTITQASQAPTSTNIQAFGRDGTTFLTNARLAFYSIGESLDLALLETRVSALITAIGAAIS